MEFWPFHNIDAFNMSMVFCLCKFWFKFWKCLANLCVTLFSINGHSLIWCPTWWQYVHCGELGLGTLFTLWTHLLQSLGTPLTMLPLWWLSLGSLYFTLTATCTPFATIGFAFGKITISYLVTNIGSTPLTFWCPKLQLLTQPHNELKVQNFEVFVQTFHSHGPFNNKEVK